MYRATGPMAVRFRGATIDRLRQAAGLNFANTVETASREIEERLPDVTTAEIQGTTPHRSAKDPTDPQDVITVGYYTARGTRILSIHAHNDGTWKEFPSRAGRERSPRREQQATSSSSTQAQNQGLSWQWNAEQGYAEWWDGQQWVQGEWSAEHQKWMAYYNGTWYKRE